MFKVSRRHFMFGTLLAGAVPRAGFGSKFPATIELEYPVPEGSTRVAEIGKCFDFCKRALGSASATWPLAGRSAIRSRDRSTTRPSSRTRSSPGRVHTSG